MRSFDYYQKLIKMKIVRVKKNFSFILSDDSFKRFDVVRFGYIGDATILKVKKAGAQTVVTVRHIVWSKYKIVNFFIRLFIRIRYWIFIGVLLSCFCLSAGAQIQTFPSIQNWILPERDTVKLLLLVTDTSTIFVNNSENKPIPMFTSRTYPIVSYLTRKKKGDQWNETFWMEPEKYFDDKMKPLSTKLIIWQAKELQ